jgi:hypothetical protein
MVRRDLSGRAIDYCRERMWLARGLEPSLRDALASGDWNAWTFAAASVAQERLEDVGAGGLASLVGNERLVLGEVAQAMVLAGPTAVWLVPDPMARPGDPFLANVAVVHVDIGDGVSYVARGRRPGELAAAWRAASSACGRIGVVTNLPDTTTSTQTDVLEAGRSARLVVVDAYDGEGALYLSDSGRPPAG